MSPISVNIGVPINATNCPICGTSMESDQSDRIVEFMRPHADAERKATVERMIGDASDLIAQGVHAIDAYHRAARAILDAVAAREGEEEQA